MTDKAQQAFPTLSSTNDITPNGTEKHAQNHYCEPGMTLRDYFAAKALSGLLSKDGCDHGHAARIAKAAYAIADAMIQAREG